MKPTVYLSNWASHATPGHHGPGHAYTIMARPRSFERGEGRVDILTPEASDLVLLQGFVLSLDEYRGRLERRLVEQADQLVPGVLDAASTIPRSVRRVEDGDTLCCSCARGAAAAGRCHRVWVAKHLSAAGWRVVLDGLAFEPGSVPV